MKKSPNSPKLTPSKITRYTVICRQLNLLMYDFINIKFGTQHQNVAQETCSIVPTQKNVEVHVGLKQKTGLQPQTTVLHI